MTAQKTLLKVHKSHSEYSTVLDMIGYSYIPITVPTQVFPVLKAYKNI